MALRSGETDRKKVMFRLVDFSNIFKNLLQVRKISLKIIFKRF